MLANSEVLFSSSSGLGGGLTMANAICQEVIQFIPFENSAEEMRDAKAEAKGRSVFDVKLVG